MSDYSMRFDTPEEAYAGFFEADAAQDSDAWAAVMSYPHVRVAAAGPTAWYDTPGDYAATAPDWTVRVKTGWVRTRGREPVRLHESVNRVLLVGGWTRLDAHDEPILYNRVTYILTRPGDSWGIQARFALGAYDGSDDEPELHQAAEAAIGQVRLYYDALARGDGDACARLCRFPLVDVGVGTATRLQNGAELAKYAGPQTGGFANLDISVAQCGPKGVNVAVTADHGDGRNEQTLVVVGKIAAGWAIAGLSRSVIG